MNILHIYIIGRVQGVGYRNWAQYQAQKRVLSGWVRNRANGCVEIMAMGPSQNLDEFRALCLAGPNLFARIDRIETVKLPTNTLPPVTEGEFKIIASA